MVLNKKVYDTLKWIAMYLLPALGTLYFALASVWGLPYGEEIVGTISAVDAFLGVVLGISKACYGGDGEFVLEKKEDAESEVALVLNFDENDLKSGDTVTLKYKGDAT